MAAANKIGTDIVQKAKSALISPTQLFNSVKGEKNYKASFVYYAVLSLIFAVLSGLVAMVMPNTLLEGAVQGVNLVSILTSWITLLVGTFIIATIVHVFVYLLGGRGGFLQTYKSYVYGITPYLLLGWLQYIGIVVSLYSYLYLFPKGLSILQNMSFRRALAAALLPVIIFTVIIVLASMFISYAIWRDLLQHYPVP